MKYRNYALKFESRKVSDYNVAFVMKVEVRRRSSLRKMPCRWIFCEICITNESSLRVAAWSNAFWLALLFSLLIPYLAIVLLLSFRWNFRERNSQKLWRKIRNSTTHSKKNIEMFSNKLLLQVFLINTSILLLLVHCK